MTEPTEHHWSTINASDENNSNRSREGGFVYAERQLHYDFWSASNLDNISALEQALTDAASAIQAEVLHTHLHHSQADGKLTGIAITPNAQISLRTWPSIGYVAIDFFISGNISHTRALSVFKQALLIDNPTENEQLHGRQLTDLTPLRSSN